VSNELYPSGPWVGFYNYQPGDRHRMQLHLTFSNGMMSGDGNDDIGRFLIKGRFDSQTAECHWTKTYVGAHDVYYRGFREGKGIWGTWEIGSFADGGFHIWPKRVGDSDALTQTEITAEPLDAIATEVCGISSTHAGHP
jgi:hypothetical protein